MAGESFNLDKEEAEILEPSAPSSSSPTPPSRPAASPPSLFPKPPHEPPTQRSGRPETPASDPLTAASGGPDEKSSARGRETESPARFANRCSSCRRRVGLTGFRCRCGDLFCARHRYSDAHDCALDYKAAGRDEICRANPVIKAAKIIKI